MFWGSRKIELRRRLPGRAWRSRCGFGSERSDLSTPCCLTALQGRLRRDMVNMMMMRMVNMMMKTTMIMRRRMITCA